MSAHPLQVAQEPLQQVQAVVEQRLVVAHDGSVAWVAASLGVGT